MINLEQILTIFPNLVHYLELIPVCVISLIAGIISYYNTENKGELPSKYSSFKIIGTSAFLGVVTYSILSSTDLNYLAKVGVSSCIAFFGIDKSLELVQKLLSLRNGGGKSDDQKTKELKDAIAEIKSSKETEKKENTKDV